jgi:ATP-dependent Clp protease adaptor protein ClpS
LQKIEGMQIKMDTSWELEEELLVEEESDEQDPKKLVVHNDDFNTFDHVINTLIKVCKHDQHQAEQCTYIIHFKGKCSVKEGSYKQLKPMREGIAEAGIKATID